MDLATAIAVGVLFLAGMMGRAGTLINRSGIAHEIGQLPFFGSFSRRGLLQ
jgi:hypothetical protein